MLVPLLVLVGIGYSLYHGFIGHVDGDWTDRRFGELQIIYALYVGGYH